MLSAGLEPAIPASQREQTQTLDTQPLSSADRYSLCTKDFNA
jgi:hypothetical protein